MALSEEKIAELLQKKNKPVIEQKKFTRMIRRKTHYPKFPKGSGVTRHDTFPPYPKLYCAARGCRTETCYKFKGIPYCIDDLAISLAHELTYNKEDYDNRNKFTDDSDNNGASGNRSGISFEGSLVSEGTL